MNRQEIDYSLSTDCKKIALQLLCAAVIFAPLAVSHAAQTLDDAPVNQEAQRDVWVYLEHKDCAGAVRALNKGIAENQRDILLLAGAMFEDGICLKPNWDQAVKMYQRAHAAGNRAGLPRLVAGYALPGRDPAAALWWAAQLPDATPEYCRVEADPLANPDAFVVALQAWPRSRLDACVYTLGVRFKVQGEVEYPRSALDYGFSGKVQMHFRPASASIEWQQGDTHIISLFEHVPEKRLRDRTGHLVKNSLLAHLQQLGSNALKQYPKPEGIDQEWLVKMNFVFGL